MTIADTDIPFAWDAVEKCMDFKLDGKDFPNLMSCPKCSCKSQNLRWISFSTGSVGNNLFFRAGDLSICTSCNIQVQFLPKIIR